MRFKDLPIPYIYCILIGIFLGLFLGTRFYWAYLLYGEASEFSWNRYFAPVFTNQFWWGVLVPMVWYCYKKFDWQTQKLQIVGASLAVALFHEITSYFVWITPMHFLGIEAFNWESVPKILKNVPTGFIGQLVQYWIIWGIFMAMDFSKKYRDKEVELAKMENQLSNAQLNALRLQLQPHFLFNTLNTISSLMEFNIKDSQKIVSKLGNLLRTVLDKEKPTNIPFREELAFIKSYLDIEQMRFNDRLKITYDVDEQTLDTLVPSLLLQPLVENAIKHGFATKADEGEIKLRAKKLAGNQLELLVADDGDGTEIINGDVQKNGIGLKNVRNRLDLIYKDNYEMEIASAPGEGFQVIIRLPVNWFPKKSS